MWAGRELIGRGVPDRSMVLRELIPCGLLAPVRGGGCLVLEISMVAITPKTASAAERSRVCTDMTRIVQHVNR